MGQYSLVQRIKETRQTAWPRQLRTTSYHTAAYRIETKGKAAGIAKAVIEEDQVTRRLASGIYRVEIRDNAKSISYLREIRQYKYEDVLYLRVPKNLSNTFTHGQHVQVTLARIDRKRFFEMTRDRLDRRYGMAEMELKDDKIAVVLDKNHFEFKVREYGYQRQYGYTGAYLTFTGPGDLDQKFKILYGGYDEPNLLLETEKKNNYRTVHSITYDPLLQNLEVEYMHSQTRQHTKTISLTEPMTETRDLKGFFERYFLALEKRDTLEMGVLGMSISAQVLKDMGYEVVWIDSTGNTPGPDISVIDDLGKKVTVEVKSSSSPDELSSKLREAISALENRYFVRTENKIGFIWHSREGELQPEASYAMAIGIEFDRRNETIGAKIVTTEPKDGEKTTLFERSLATWRIIRNERR